MGCCQSAQTNFDPQWKTGHEWYLQLDLYKNVILWSGWSNAAEFYTKKMTCDEYNQRIDKCLRTRRMYFDTQEFVYRPMNPLWYPLPASFLSESDLVLDDVVS